VSDTKQRKPVAAQRVSLFFGGNGPRRRTSKIEKLLTQKKYKRTIREGEAFGAPDHTFLSLDGVGCMADQKPQLWGVLSPAGLECFS